MGASSGCLLRAYDMILIIFDSFLTTWYKKMFQALLIHETGHLSKIPLSFLIGKCIKTFAKDAHCFWVAFTVWRDAILHLCLSSYSNFVWDLASTAFFSLPYVKLFFSWSFRIRCCSVKFQISIRWRHPVRGPRLISFESLYMLRLIAAPGTHLLLDWLSQTVCSMVALLCFSNYLMLFWDPLFSCRQYSLCLSYAFSCIEADTMHTFSVVRMVCSHLFVFVFDTLLF